jgi:THUMP domain-like
VDYPSRRDCRGRALGGRRRQSQTTLRPRHAELAAGGIGGAAAGGTRTRSLSLRTCRRRHPGWTIAALGAQLGAGLLDSQIAYLTSDQLCMTPLATAFEVREQLPFHLKAPHKWVRQGQIGVLENKKRGVDVEPAELRRRLRLSGPNSATMVISATPSHVIAATVERVDHLCCIEPPRRNPAGWRIDVRRRSICRHPADD